MVGQAGERTIADAAIGGIDNAIDPDRYVRFAAVVTQQAHRALARDFHAAADLDRDRMIGLMGDVAQAIEETLVVAANL
jgi:hypothetical protein